MYVFKTISRGRQGYGELRFIFVCRSNAVPLSCYFLFMGLSSDCGSLHLINSRVLRSVVMSSTWLVGLHMGKRGVTKDRQKEQAIRLSDGSRSEDHVEAEEDLWRKAESKRDLEVTVEERLVVWRGNGEMMGRRNKAEHINEGEGMKEM